MTDTRDTAPLPESGGVFFVKAVLDVGTNSVKMLAARLDLSGGMEITADGVAVTRLGEGTAETGLLGGEAMRRTVEAMRVLRGKARMAGAEEITAVGTQALRAAANSSEFIALAEAECGVHVRVISGDEEAELSFMAACSAAPQNPSGGDTLVFDIGGGSSEIALGRGASAAFRRSVPTGVLQLREKFFAPPGGGPVAPEAVAAAELLARSEFERRVAAEASLRGVSAAVGVGGTVNALASVSAASPDGCGGVSLTLPEIERQAALYASMDSERRKKIPGLPPGRADIILPGACIVKAIMTLAEITEITACGRGLRHALMEKELGIY